MFALKKSAATSQTILRCNQACFGTAPKEALLTQIAEEASKISDYNFRSYFMRRANEDKANADSFSEQDLKERLE